VEAEKGYSTDIRSKADWEDEVLGIAGGGKIERNRGKCCIFPPRNFFDNFFWFSFNAHQYASIGTSISPYKNDAVQRKLNTSSA
jgi:hypothetical protein